MTGFIVMSGYRAGRRATAPAHFQSHHQKPSPSAQDPVKPPRTFETAKTPMNIGDLYFQNLA